MKTISATDYEALCDSGRPDDVKRGYPAMIYHPDDTISKTWANPIGFFSSARLKHYARRFIDNAAVIKSLDIPAPEILDYFKIKNTHIRIVRYKILPGHSIRELLENDPEKLDIPSLAAFIHGLHEKGIEFRTIHLGNIIQMENKTYGLIDFCDIRQRKKPLSPKRRAVNLAMPIKYNNDMALMQNAGLPNLKEIYLKTWSPNEKHQEIFLACLQKRLNRH